MPSYLPDLGVFQNYTSYLLDDSLLVDCGSASFALSSGSLKTIRDIFITHAHMDHVASLPILIDTCLGYKIPPPRIWASRQTIQQLREHFFNQSIWPNYSEVQIHGRPALDFQEFSDAQPIQVQDYRITPVAVNHSVATHGLIIESANSAVIFSSDTGPTEEIWHWASSLSRLNAVFLELSYSSDFSDLAQKAGHLTPKTFLNEIRKIQNHQPIFMAVHLKPWMREAIVREIQEWNHPRIQMMKSGVNYNFGD